MGLSVDSRKLLEELKAKALGILQAAESDADRDTALAAIGEVRALVDLLDRDHPGEIVLKVLDPRTGEAVPISLPPMPPPAGQE